MKKILYVDANVNRDTSRTERLAQALLERLDGSDVTIETLVLEDELKAGRLAALTGEESNRRMELSKAGDFSESLFKYAMQFAAADEIVFAAPYWDFSFPAMLKIYFELLCAQGVTFVYSPEGIPTGMCNAKRAYYVTTVGGYSGDWDYGFDQVKALCQLYFGIEDVKCFRAEGLDIITNDPKAIMDEAIKELNRAQL